MNFVERFGDYFSYDLAIDLGTANTLVYVKSHGIVLDEPSVVAVRQTMDGRPTKVLAVGKEAKEMLGRTPGGIEAIRPVKDGVIADFHITQAMLKCFMHKAISYRKSILKQRLRVIVCVPYNITQVEKRAVKEAAYSAGAREVYLMEEPMAAAIGAELPVTEPTGNIIVDIGGGTTSVSVISLGGIIYCKSIKIAGDKFDESIVNYIHRHFKLLIGEPTAEFLKVKIGNAYPFETLKIMDVKGRDLTLGSPKVIEVTSDQIREALNSPLTAILDAVRLALERTPPELASDIVDNGIILTGGGALLANLDTLLREATQIPVSVAERPLRCVVLGAGQILDQMDLLRQLEVS